jgi:selenocysteine-specific elongation factor
MTVVVGTAGHIDHGKTTLLRALTGIDADRLPEERRRGMTIDVGYAHLRLPDGFELDFVDVPGHDRLVGNMLVGAGEIDAAMLVIAADDGPRAQTIEHLELLDALGIDEGLAVVTKIDAVSPERAREVIDDASRLLARTRLAGSAVLAVSAASGAGLPEVLGQLDRLRERLTVGDPRGGPARLAIDRAFSMKGRGTVVTGTLRGGDGVRRGDTLRLLPGGREIRVREVQVHGETVERAIAGRTALNLVGADVSELHRGMVLTADPELAASDRILVALLPAAGLTGPSCAVPSDRARVRLHIATEQVGATVGRSGRDGAELPGGEASAILRLARPVALAPGDRFVLRRASPAETLAGGRVLDVEPPRGVGRRRVTKERLTALAAAVAADATATAGATEAARLDLHGALADGHVHLAPDVASALRAAILAEMERAPAGRTLADLRAAAATTLRRGVRLAPEAARDAAAHAIDWLVADGTLDRVGETVSIHGRAPVGLSAAVLAAMDRLVATLDVLAPPPLAGAARAVGCPADGIRALEAAGRIVRLDDDLAYAATTYATLEETATTLAAAAPLTPAAFRDATGTSRKYVMAILEDLDRRGVLRRTADGHVPGPRAATAGAPGGRR